MLHSTEKSTEFPKQVLTFFCIVSSNVFVDFFPTKSVNELKLALAGTIIRNDYTFTHFIQNKSELLCEYTFQVGFIEDWERVRFTWENLLAFDIRFTSCLCITLELAVKHIITGYYGSKRSFHSCLNISDKFQSLWHNSEVNSENDIRSVSEVCYNHIYGW